MKDNMFKKLKRGGKKTGDALVDGVDKVVISKVDKNRVIKDACRTGNIIQLVSRVTGHNLQWMATKETLDGLGCSDKDARSTLWTVNLVSNNIKDGIILQLHNEGYFLSIVDGETKLAEYEDLSAAGEDTHLKISIVEQFIRLESADDSGHHIGVLSNGDLKAAIATGTEMESHFAPKVIHSIPMENGDHVKSSTEVLNGGGVELEPVENEQDNINKSKDDIKEDGEEKPDKKKSKLKKLKESFRKRSKSQELLASKTEPENKEVEVAGTEVAETEATETISSTETTVVEETVKSTEETTEVKVKTDIPEEEKIEVLESTNESEAVTIAS